MLALFVFLALTCGALADDCCSTEDRREVSYLWKNLWASAYTGRRVKVAQAIFADLFEHHPAAVDLFKRVNGSNIDSPEFKAHCVRVVNGLDTVINMLHSPSTAKAQLAHLNSQHLGREGIKAAHFDAFGASVVRVLPQVASCFNTHAWNRCFTRVARAISAGLP